VTLAGDFLLGNTGDQNAKGCDITSCRSGKEPRMIVVLPAKVKPEEGRLTHEWRAKAFVKQEV
jgi:hypothetical protein